MITLPRHVRVHAYAAPADMRKGYEGLSVLVRDELGRDPLSGDLFLFTNRTRRRAKVLLFDGTGLCLYCTRLDKGIFAKLWRDETRHEIALTVSELTLFLEGSALVGRVKLSPDEITRKDLAIAIAK